MDSRTIDWEAIKRRLATTEAAISGDLGSDQVARDRILEARARAAARPTLAPDPVERIEVLAFSLAAEMYAVETRYVREVCQLKDLTPIPGAPTFLAGALNLRGRIVAIVDLRAFFQLPTRGLTELNRIIVLKGGDEEFGLLADGIEGIESLPISELRTGPLTLAGIREKFLRGVTGRMLAVLDGARLLTDTSLKIDDPATRQKS